MPFAIAALLALTGPARFDFKDAKAVNAVSFSTDGVVEPFVGIARGVSGSLNFDASHPERTSGTIVVDANSLELPMKDLEDSMKAAWCLDVKGHPTIELKVRQLDKVVTKGNVTTALLTGDFTCRGVTKQIQAPASATFLAGKAKDRYGDDPGDLLVIRCDFSFNRLDFGVGKSLGPDLVSDEVKVHVGLVGTFLYPKSNH